MTDTSDAFGELPELKWGRLVGVSLGIIICIILLVFLGYRLKESTASASLSEPVLLEPIADNKPVVPKATETIPTIVSKFKVIIGVYDGYTLARSYADYMASKLPETPYLWSVDNDQLYAIQSGAYSTLAEAKAAQSILVRQGVSAIIWESGTDKQALFKQAVYVDNKSVNYPYKLIAGIVTTKSETALLLAALEKKGIHHAYTWSRTINNQSQYYIQLGAYKQESHARTEQAFYSGLGIDTLIQIIQK